MSLRHCLLSLVLLLSGCYLSQYPVTPAIAAESTYKVLVGDRQGTAWAVGKHHLVTAGHVCETMDADFTLVGKVRRFHATAVEWEYNGSTRDLCILYTPAALERPLVIANSMPGVMDVVGYVGFPLGEFRESKGNYLGDLDGEMEYNNAVFSAECDHGASGAAVFTPKGVWGVLVRVRTDGGYIHDGSDGCAAIALPELRAILNSAGVNYTSVPEVLDDI